MFSRGRHSSAIFASIKKERGKLNIVFADAAYARIINGYQIFRLPECATVVQVCVSMYACSLGMYSRGAPGNKRPNGEAARCRRRGRKKKSNGAPAGGAAENRIEGLWRAKWIATAYCYRVALSVASEMVWRKNWLGTPLTYLTTAGQPAWKIGLEGDVLCLLPISN